MATVTDSGRCAPDVQPVPGGMDVGHVMDAGHVMDVGHAGHVMHGAMRADRLLVTAGHAATRAQAQRLIAAGVAWRAAPAAPWQPVTKCGQALAPGAELRLLDDSEARYCSRGGLKLEAALAATGVRVAQRRCLDVGQSTGGFSDCLLQHGAAQVVGVDAGHGQLHARLRADARVLCIEGVNARTLTPALLQQACAQALSARAGECGTQPDTQSAPASDPATDTTPVFNLLTADLSFISLTLVLPALVPLLATGGDALLLVKPQFELQARLLGKGGIVRDAALYAQVEQRLRACCAALGLVVRAWFASAITGGDGNREFFLYAGAVPHLNLPVAGTTGGPQRGVAPPRNH